MLFIGICGITYEYTFSKLASDILGDSVKQWAIIIGLMMLFMGIGADLQKHFPDQTNIDQFIFLEIILGFLGGIGPATSLITFGHFHDYFVLVHYSFICVIGLLIGLEIPLLSRVNQRVVPSLKNNLGMILKMDYIGSFIGALIWVFILPGFLNILEMSFFMGIINVLVALFTWYWFRDKVKYSKLIPFSGVCVLIVLSIGLLKGEKISITAEQKLYQDPIIFSQTSLYQRIIVTESHNDVLYLYINGHLQFSSADEHIYHEFLVHPILGTAQNRKNILVLGGGDGLAVREILKYPDVESITLVDLDPAMTTMARTHKKLVELNEGALLDQRVFTAPAKGIVRGKRVTLNQKGIGFFRKEKIDKEIQVHIYNIDAFEFVRSFDGIFDAIIIDFPDPNNLALSKLYSREFYTLLKKKLSFNGILIQQSTSPTFAKEVFLLIGRTMESAGFSSLPIHQSVPSFGDWGWWIAGHQDRYGKQGLRKRLLGELELPEKVKYITPELIRGSLNFGKNELATDHEDINTILQDRVFREYQKAWRTMQ